MARRGAVDCGVDADGCGFGVSVEGNLDSFVEEGVLLTTDEQSLVVLWLTRNTSWMAGHENANDENRESRRHLLGYNEEAHNVEGPVHDTVGNDDIRVQASRREENGGWGEEQ